LLWYPARALAGNVISKFPFSGIFCCASGNFDPEARLFLPVIVPGEMSAKGADKAGFESEFYFSRLFKKKTGQTPSEFRRKKQQDYPT